MKRVSLVTMLLAGIVTASSAQSISKERMQYYKSCVGAIVIDGRTVGTGFVVSSDGAVLTCFHVGITSASAVLGKSPHTQIRFDDGRLYDVDVFRPGDFKFLGPLFKYYDFLIYKMRDVEQKLPFLMLGRWSTLEEGDHVISVGYPYGFDKAFVSQGLFSTKLQDQTVFEIAEGGSKKMTLNYGSMDLTLNTGNSGGPIIKRGKTIDDDRIVGIATAIHNPNHKMNEFIHQQLVNERLTSFPDTSQYTVQEVFSNTLLKNSVGISYCYSVDSVIDYLYQFVKK